MAILVCKKGDNRVPESPGKWRNGEIVTAVKDDHVFGSSETPESDNFYHVNITDKTLEEVQAYLQSWSHDPTVEQTAANGDDRTIQVTSTMVSASGGGAFEAASIDGMLAELAEDYPGSNPVRTALSDSSFEFTITAPVAARDEIVERVNDVVRRMAYRRRRWYINAAGRTYMDANNNQVAGTASQVAGYLRDGLLD